MFDKLFKRQTKPEDVLQDALIFYRNGSSEPLSIIVDRLVDERLKGKSGSDKDAFKDKMYKILHDMFFFDSGKKRPDSLFTDKVKGLYAKLTAEKDYGRFLAIAREILDMRKEFELRRKTGDANGIVWVKELGDNELLELRLIVNNPDLLENMAEAIKENGGPIKQTDFVKASHIDKAIVPGAAYALSKYGFLDRETNKNRVQYIRVHGLS